MYPRKSEVPISSTYLVKNEYEMVGKRVSPYPMRKIPEKIFLLPSHDYRKETHK